MPNSLARANGGLLLAARGVKQRFQDADFNQMPV